MKNTNPLNLLKGINIWGVPQSVCVTYELGVYPPDHLTVDIDLITTPLCGNP